MSQIRYNCKCQRAFSYEKCCFFRCCSCSFLLRFILQLISPNVEIMFFFSLTLSLCLSSLSFLFSFLLQMKTLPAGGSSQHFYLFLYVYVLLSVAFFIIYFRPPLPTTCTCVPSTSTLLPNNAVLSKPMRIAPANSKPATAGLHKPVRAEDIVAECANVISDAFPKKNQSFFVPRDHVVNKLDPAWLIQAPPCPLDGPSLLVVIPSMDGDKNRRKAIRETWAGPAYGRAWPGSRRAWGHSSSTVKVVFFLGVSTIYTQQTVEQEAEAHRDIVRADFTEAYHNLSLKMSFVLHWVATFCPGARHVIKVDQDTFVNLPLLLDVLELLSAKRSRFVLGRKHGAFYPPVVRWGRWKVSEDIYPLASFPR